MARQRELDTISNVVDDLCKDTQLHCFSLLHIMKTDSYSKCGLSGAF